MRQLKDTFRHQGMRNQLVKQLQKEGITNSWVLSSIESVPRHLFLDPAFEAHAYQNKAFPIAASQTISHPYTVAFQTDLLGVKKGAKILEIGTGSGYQAAVLCHLGMEVYSIERQRELYKSTRKLLPKLGYRPKQLIFGDGYLGYLEAAPYDGILVTAGAPSLPQKLLLQLKIGAKLVIPIGVNAQEMYIYTRTGEKTFEKENKGNFHFVPMLSNKAY